MKSILVPIDFSKASENAFIYALNLAKSFGAAIDLLHVFHFHSKSHFISLERIDALEKKEKLEATHKLNAYLEDFKSRHPDLDISNIKIEVIVRMGLVVESILSLTENFPIDMVVMGATGESNGGVEFMGSKTITVIENVDCPVLAIPNGITYQPIHRIVYATDLKAKNIAKLDTLVNFSRRFDAEVVLLHVNKEKHLNTEQVNKLLDECKTKHSYDKVSFFSITDNDINDGITQYVSEHGADIIAMAIRERSIYQKIFMPSLTRKMAYNTTLPLLAYAITH